MGSKIDFKKFSVIIVCLVITFFSIVLISDYDKQKLEESLNNETVLSKKDIEKLINIDELSDDFMDDYFEDVSKLEPKDKDNLLIVISDKEVKETYGAKDVIEAPNNQYYLIYDKEEEKNKAFQKLQNDSNIIGVEENQIITIETRDEEVYDEDTTTNSEYNSWGIEQLGYDYAINAIEEIKQANPSKIQDVVVAVMDTGLDVDILTGKFSDKLLGVYDAVVPSAEMTDATSHGTHVFGTVAESTPSNVKIVAVKIFDHDRNKTGDEGSCYFVDYQAAVNYIVNKKNATGDEKIDTDVINMSFGGYGASNSYNITISSLLNVGIMVVASSGNDNTNMYHFPSDIDGVISIGTIDSHLYRPRFSNFGSGVDFTAPGYRIKSISKYSDKIIKSGTSMSTPHVTSAVAILKSFNKDLTEDEVIKLLSKYSIDIGDDGWDKYYGNGVVNFNGVEFCDDDVNCDEYGVYKNTDVETLPTIKIESSTDVFTPVYNYGSITNIMYAEINLYYTETNYYTKTLAQIIDNIDISGYDPYKYEIQNVTIKYKDLEPIILKVDNTNIGTDDKLGWVYEELEDGTISLNGFKSCLNSIKTSYFIVVYPQVVYIPSEIDGKKVSKLGSQLFMDREDLIRVVIPEGVTTIDEYVFANSEKYSAEGGPVDIVIPNSVTSISDTSFSNKRKTNIIFNLYDNNTDSYLNKYVSNNKIAYNYPKEININLETSEYKAFEKVKFDNVPINIIYATQTTQCLAFSEDDCTSYNIVNGTLNETVSEYTIEYQNGDSFRYGDTTFTINFETNKGYYIEKEISVTVEKATPEYVIPNDLKGIYGQTLKEIELPNGFEWMNTEEKITETGNVMFKAKYIPEDTENYEIVENIDINVLIEKEIIIPEITIADKTYDGTTSILEENITISNLNKEDYTIESAILESVDVGETKARIKIKLTEEKYKNYTLPNKEQEQEFEVDVKIVPQKLKKPTLIEKTYTYTGEEQEIELNDYVESKMDIVGNKRTEAGEQEVIIILKNANYIWEDGTNTELKYLFVIEKAIPEYIIPKDLSARTEQTLKEIELPNGFEWMNPKENITETGNITFKAKYTPTDTYNYEIVENVDLVVFVKNARIKIVPEIIITDKVYDGTTSILEENITISNLNKEDYIIESAVLESTDAGETKAKIKIKLTEEKYDVYCFGDNKQEQEFEVDVKIVPQKLKKPTLIEKTYTYTGEEQEIELNDYDESKMDIVGNKRTEAGEQEVIITLKNTNYIWEDGTNTELKYTFVIEKAKLNITDNSTDVTIKYDGQLHSIDIKLEYDSNINLKYMDENNEYILNEIPKYSEVGTYIIKYKLYIDANYTEYYGEKTLNIINNTIINNTIDYEGIYDGKDHSINIDIELEEYEIKYSIDNTNYDLNELPEFKEVGEYTINYKITSYGHDNLIGSNKVKIYGIKKFDPTLIVKEKNIIINNNSFENISNKITTYSKSSIYSHYDKDNEFITSDVTKTGDKIRININNEKDYEYEIAVSGDINGDGLINSADLLKIRQHLLKTITLTGVYYNATDINNDGLINSADLLRIRQHLLGIKPIM